MTRGCVYREKGRGWLKGRQCSFALIRAQTGKGVCVLVAVERTCPALVVCVNPAVKTHIVDGLHFTALRTSWSVTGHGVEQIQWQLPHTHTVSNKLVHLFLCK